MEYGIPVHAPLMNCYECSSWASPSFSNRSSNLRPFSVSRYFWRRLVGFSGIVRSISPSARAGSIYRLRRWVRSLSINFISEFPRGPLEPIRRARTATATGGVTGRSTGGGTRCPLGANLVPTWSESSPDLAPGSDAFLRIVNTKKPPSILISGSASPAFRRIPLKRLAGLSFFQL